MRKLILTLALAASALPMAAQAQSYGEVRDSRRELRQEQRQLDRARMYGDRQDIREQRRDVRDARREVREDWRDYRRSHRDVYRQPRYAGPAGYRYRPVVVGQRWAPAYYSQRYWISDPYRYRLPSPGRWERWVRYGNDVVLVNTRNGVIVRSYNGFFW